MDNDLKCPICGKPTYLYYGKNPRKDRLCQEHGTMAYNGEIKQCPDCAAWHRSDEECKCRNTNKKYTELPTEGFEKCVVCDNKTKGYAFCKECYKKLDHEKMLEILNRVTYKTEIKKSENNIESRREKAEITTILDTPKKQEIKIGKCLTCSNNTLENYLFCGECYKNYKNKTLLLKVEKCLTVTIQDESYEGIYICDDGHIVKSMAERDIDNWLFSKQIRHSYEPQYDTGKEGAKPIHPDFRLEQYFGEGEETLNGHDTDVYIEYWGYDESYKEYTERKKYKMDIYKKNKETLICLYGGKANDDVQNLNFALKTKLRKEKIKKNEINYEK